MNCAREARKLADFISNLDEFKRYDVANEFSYTHIGALFTDIVLQAGVNYTTVVRPRVNQVLVNYPEAYTVKKFQEVVEREGLETIINWKHDVKIERIKRLINFCLENEINSCADLKIYLLKKNNQEKLLEINGVGPKTLDYLLKLLNFDTVAVDRHIYSFVEMAEIDAKGYHPTKKIVEYAADFLEVSRASIDYSIWKFMSNKEPEVTVESNQLSFAF
jgi:hypothetical protein